MLVLIYFSQKNVIRCDFIELMIIPCQNKIGNNSYRIQIL